MTDTVDNMVTNLFMWVQRRLQVEEDLELISNPDDRALLASKAAKMKEAEQDRCNYIAEHTQTLFAPLWKEAMEALDDDELSIEDAMKWQAGRGNELATTLIESGTVGGISAP